MSRVKPSQFFTPNQGEFFPGLAQPWDAGNAPALDLGTELLGALCAALREARDRGLSRERIVGRINLCLAPDQRITLRQLNTWTAPSAEGKRFPAEYLPAEQVRAGHIGGEESHGALRFPDALAVHPLKLAHGVLAAVEDEHRSSGKRASQSGAIARRLLRPPGRRQAPGRRHR